MVGERRVGKSSLLLRVIENALGKKIIPCRVDVELLDPEDPWDFWHQVFDSIVASGHLLTGSKQSGTYLFSDYSDRYAKNQQSPRPPVSLLSSELSKFINSRPDSLATLILFDEAQNLAESSRVQAEIRSMLRDVDALGIGFFGDRSLLPVFESAENPLYAQVRPVVHLGNFANPSDITQCILLPLTEEQRDLVDPLTVQYVTRLSLGKPNQVQLICSSIFRRFATGHQPDLRISIDAVEDVLSELSSGVYDEEAEERFTAIKRLAPPDLELLYSMTRFPGWTYRELAEVDECFRGASICEDSLERRIENLQAVSRRFEEFGLIDSSKGRVSLKGDEFLYLYLRFHYELSKFERLNRSLFLGDQTPTIFGEKVGKFIDALAWETDLRFRVVNLGIVSGDSGFDEFTARLQRRWSLLDSLRAKKVPDDRDLKAFGDLVNVCQLMESDNSYGLTYITIRNLDNTRDSINVELYARSTKAVEERSEPAVHLLKQQAESGRLLIEGIGVELRSVPSMRVLMEDMVGRDQFESFLGQMPVSERWRIKSLERHAGGRSKGQAQSQTHSDQKPITSDSGVDDIKVNDEIERRISDSLWLTKYRESDIRGAVMEIRELFGHQGIRRLNRARMHNDLGYMLYSQNPSDPQVEIEYRHALDLHFRDLSLTLLNRAVVRIDAESWDDAIEDINTALLLVKGREQLEAGYLDLRLMRPPRSKLVRFEQNPANVLEAAYVNLAFAVGHVGDDDERFDNALSVLDEGFCLLPNSDYLTWAKAGVLLAMTPNNPDDSDRIYVELAQKRLPETMRSDVAARSKEAHQRARRKSRNRR